MHDLSAHKRLAISFARVLREWLTNEEWIEMRRRNALSPDLICASYDFCDANEAMLVAFERCFGCEPDLRSDDIFHLINRAWEVASYRLLTANL